MSQLEKVEKEVEKRLAKLASAAIKSHKLFNQADYDYLKGKGYSDAEILKFWDNDKSRGHTEGQRHENKPWRP